MWVARQTPQNERQFTLWSCCLLSKAWYSTALKRLYRSPVLSSRNFEQFTQTLCPPLSSHNRTIGLETLVRDLDMGMLAYESSKSLTARLLHRTQTNMESFVAPSITFSSPCLAPLSKAGNLHTLDLSNDYDDCSLGQLLHALRKSSKLRFLSLPKRALRKAYLADSMLPQQHQWPPSLTHLQANYLFPENSDAWLRFLKHLPESLVSLTFEQCHNYRSFDSLTSLRYDLSHIEELHIGDGRRNLLCKSIQTFQSFAGLGLSHAHAIYAVFFRNVVTTDLRHTDPMSCIGCVCHPKTACEYHRDMMLRLCVSFLCSYHPCLIP